MSGALDHWTAVGQTRWVWFLCLGIALIVGGGLAIMLPAVSTVAASFVLGLVLAVVGVVQIIHAFRTPAWPGFLWGLLIGVVQLVGGGLIYLNPLAGAIAVALLIALVFVIQGLAQVGLALRLRPQTGWGWLLLSGVIALCASAALILKIPYNSVYTPGTITGVSLLFAGGAYIAMAISARKMHTLAFGQASNDNR